MIQDEIKDLERKLKHLRDKQKESIDSVMKATGGNWNYYSSLKDKSEQVMCLIEGRVYSPYDCNRYYRIKRQKKWKTEEYMDYFLFYDKDYGSPLGFISVLTGLFDATSNLHRKMWITAVKENNEIRSLEDFTTNLKEVDFLKKSLELYSMERGTGVYSTKPYLMEYENRKLKIEKHYIYFYKGTRKL